MSRFSIALIRLATLALLGSAGTAAYAQQTIDQNKALAGNVTPGDAPGFPITISVPGSYKLMSNLNVPQGATSAIAITASGVTLDLNGFNVVGPIKCFQAYETGPVSCSPSSGPAGILAGGTKGVRVRNGLIRGFKDQGLVLGQSGVAAQLHIEQILGYGVSGDFVTVSNVTVQEVAYEGINLNTSGVVETSAARFNGGMGIVAGLIHNSHAYGNRKSGMSGRVRGNWSTNNGGSNFGFSPSMGGNMNDSSPY